MGRRQNEDAQMAVTHKVFTIVYALLYIAGTGCLQKKLKK